MHCQAVDYLVGSGVERLTYICCFIAADWSQTRRDPDTRAWGNRGGSVTPVSLCLVKTVPWLGDAGVVVTLPGG